MAGHIPGAWTARGQEAWGSAAEGLPFCVRAVVLLLAPWGDLFLQGQAGVTCLGWSPLAFRVVYRRHTYAVGVLGGPVFWVCWLM